MMTAGNVISIRATSLAAVAMLICLSLCSIGSFSVRAKLDSEIVGTLVNDFLTVDLYAHGGFRARLSSDSDLWITFPSDTGMLSLKIDQAEYKLYPEPNPKVRLFHPFTVKETEAEIAWMIDGLQVAQRLRLRAENMEMLFDVTNLRTVEAAVRLRLLIDTQVGQNDGAPFYVEGYGIFTKETFFSLPGNLSFSRWWACANPEDSFRSICHLLSRPYKLSLAYWWTAKNTIFDYQIDPRRAFFQHGRLKFPESDSCVLIWFNLEPLPPSSKRTILLTYGVP